jgi:hypothetical protein
MKEVSERNTALVNTYRAHVGAFAVAVAIATPVVGAYEI